ncbi:MAG: hypothetical protein ACRC33_14335, partial [Gemmataceae bacterium]
MPRATLCVVLVVGLLVCAARAAEPDQRILSRLAVQKALDDAQDHLKRGNYRDAVTLLEKHVAHIDGNRTYLVALRDAYAGHVAQLKATGDAAEAARYADRLAILQPPGTAAELAGAPLNTPAPERATPVPAKLASGPKMLALGKVDDRAAAPEDPFGPANRAAPVGVAGVVERADRAFAAKDYEAAGRLYDQAADAAAGERWAYCKLFRVARAINGEGIPAGDELEREIGEAVRMCPKVEAWAGQLRATMRDAVAGVAVKHTARVGTGWAVAETANFRVFHATTEEAAEKAARLAEATRAAMGRKWLGAAPPAWTPRCDIYLHPTVKGYTLAGGRDGSPGHSSISLPDGRVTARRVDLRMDDPNVFGATLPHEATHVVLAGQFGKHHVPRWADEGMAVLSESRERVGQHVRNLPAFRREGKLFRVETMLKLEDYPDAERITPFYAQSVSLVEFLVAKKGAVTLTRF